MMANLSSKFEKMDWVAKVPWQAIGIALAVSYTLTTVGALVVGYYLLPNNKVQNVNSGIVADTFEVPMGASLNKKAITSIVGRNIFNSEGKTPEDEENKDKVKDPNKALTKSSLPLVLRGIIYGGKPNSGLAVIEMKSKSINSFMVGDSVMAGVNVLEIYEEKVILSNSGSREYLELQRPEPPKSKRDKSKKQAPANVDAAKPLAPIATDPPPETFSEEGFERHGGKISMTQEYKKRMLTTNFAQVLQDAKAEPYVVNGELKGFTLTRIRQDSIYQKSGLQNGDVVLEINGNPLNDTGRTIRLLNSMRNETRIEVRLERAGVPQNVVIEIGN